MNSIYIRKPLSIQNGIPYIAIRYETLKRSGSELKVITDHCEAIINPVEWIKTGKRIEKVFKIPDHPMILYANYLKGKIHDKTP